jgi:HlyD family secretion protein
MNAKQKKKGLKPFIIGGVALAALAVAILAFSKPAEESAAAAVPLSAEAVNGTISISVEAVSVAEAVAQVALRNRQAGLVRFALPEGAKVAAGDVVAVMDDTELRKSLAQAELALKQAQVSLERLKAAEAKAGTDLESRRALFASKAATQEQVDLAGDALASATFARRSGELSVEQASLTLEQARRDLAEATLRAPFAGVVSKPDFGPGDYAPANSQLATVVDLSRLQFRAEVDEYDIGKLREGLQATVRIPALDDASFRSKIQSISPIADIVNSISVFKVSAFVDNADGLLRPGMSADVTFMVSNEKGVVIPLKAVTTVRGRSYVDIPAPEGGETETRRIEIGSDDGRNVIVTEGLELGEFVLLPGAPAPAAPALSKTPSGSSIIPISVPGSGGGGN